MNLLELEKQELKFGLHTVQTRYSRFHLRHRKNENGTYSSMLAFPIDREVRLMVDQHVLPAKPFSFPTHLTSGPASENMLMELCNSFTMENQSVK